MASPSQPLFIFEELARAAEVAAVEAEKIPPVLIADHLTKENLTLLLENKVAVLRVPNFVPSELCEKLTSHLWSSPDREPYTHEVYQERTLEDGSVVSEPVHLYLGVDRIGVPFNSTYGKANDSAEVNRYFSEALPSIKKMRAASYPYPSPAENLRLQFDEILPNGAQVASINGKKMLCGIGRLMNAEDSIKSEEQPHFDSMPPASIPITQQFSANFYLQVPDKGGELEIWNLPPLSYDHIETLDQSEDIRGSLPKDSIKVRPAKGDLILFNTRRPHAICSFPEGTRTSMQTFIGVNDNKPLILWN